MREISEYYKDFCRKAHSENLEDNEFDEREFNAFREVALDILKDRMKSIITIINEASQKPFKEYFDEVLSNSKEGKLSNEDIDFLDSVFYSNIQKIRNSIEK